MLTDKQLRVDKWLWAVRIFRTRSLATDACRKGRVQIGGQPVRPSRILKPGDVVQVRRPPVVYHYRVKGLLAKRLSARLVQEYVENITPDSELEKLKVRDTFFVVRDRGTGRPTKKERRTMDKLTGRLNREK
jgi:ribosome-associated heat shock protein Hsp15